MVPMDRATSRHRHDQQLDVLSIWPIETVSVVRPHHHRHRLGQLCQINRNNEIRKIFFFSREIFFLYTKSHSLKVPI